MDRDAIRGEYDRLIAAGREGFTIDERGREASPAEGYAVAVSQHGSLDDALARMEREGEGVCLGWWRDGEDGREYIDLVQIYARLGTAQVAAFLTGQVCIYDFANDDLIDCTYFYEECEKGERGGGGYG